MATTRIISLHGRKGHSIAQTLRDRINYAENPEKTNGGRLVSSYECSPETAADEFAAGKYIYKATTGKRCPRLHDPPVLQAGRNHPGGCKPDRI